MKSVAFDFKEREGIMRKITTQLGFAALRAHIAPPRMRSLARYRDLWALKVLLDRLRITLLLDIGANIGMFAEAVRLMGFTGRIISFEPNPMEYDKLRRRSSCYSEWTAEPYALGGSEGTASLNITGGDSTYSSILTPKNTPPVTHVVPITVHRLDNLWERLIRNTDRVFLKTDTQGYDLNVLQGTGARLADILGLQIELNVIKLYEGSPHYLGVLAFLESSGFLLSALRPISYNRRLFVQEFDCLAARASALTPATEARSA